MKNIEIALQYSDINYFTIYCNNKYWDGIAITWYKLFYNLLQQKILKYHCNNIISIILQSIVMKNIK